MPHRVFSVCLVLLCTACSANALLGAPPDWAANWMERMRSANFLAGNQTLQQITLPGTHDSGAYNLTRELAPDASGSEVRSP